MRHPILLTVRTLSICVSAVHTRAHTQPFREGSFSVGPVGGAAVAGLVALGLLLHAVGLTALTWTPLQGKTRFSLQVSGPVIFPGNFA